MYASELAIVTKSKGAVTYKKNTLKDFEKTVKAGKELYDDDLLKTGIDGFVMFMYLDDGTLIKVHKNSEVYISGKISDRSINKRVNAGEGFFRFDVKEQKGDEFTVVTPSSVASVKGTDFVIDIGPEGDIFYGFEGIVEVSNKIASFTDIPVYEGASVVTRTSFDTSLKSQRFKIENPSADLNTLVVNVYQSVGSSVFQEYKRADSVLDIGSDDNVYFISEIEDEQYEIFFGDNILGNRPDNGEIVEISYISTNGPSSNGAKSFTFNGRIEDENNVAITVPFNVSTVTTVSKSSGGADIESIEKIKYNAPKFYGSQNRAVTSNDYSAIVRNLYPSISDIIVFGGEDQVPPEYGKVFISVKPNEAASLSALTKSDLTQQLRQYTVASVKPQFIDPSILYVELDSKIYFDGTKTNKLPTEVASTAATGIVEYLKTSETEKFNGKFRYSKFIGVIDGSDHSINSNNTTVTLRKDFYAQINASSYYEVCYQNPFLKDCDNPVLSSTGMTVFEYPNYTTYLEDRDGKIVLYRLDSLTGEKILLNDSIGDIDYMHGEVKLYNFTILKGSFSDNRVELRVKPANKDIEVKREVYLDVDISKSTFVAYKE